MKKGSRLSCYIVPASIIVTLLFLRWRSYTVALTDVTPFLVNASPKASMAQLSLSVEDAKPSKTRQIPLSTASIAAAKPAMSALPDKVVVMAKMQMENTDWVARELPEFVSACCTECFSLRRSQLATRSVRR